MDDMRNKDGLTEEQFLAQYDASMWERPSTTVDMLVFTVLNREAVDKRRLAKKDLAVLMIRRSDHPCIGQWALPGGFVEMNENLDQAAQRELQEETGIENLYMEQLYTFGDVGRDPRTRIISSSYMTLVDSESLGKIQAGSDAQDVSWFKVNFTKISDRKTGSVREQNYQLELDNGTQKIQSTLRKMIQRKGRVTSTRWELIQHDGIAFDHAKIITYGLERLRNKIEYTDIAFNLMPDLFTLSELQQVYEVILGKELLKANFRRKISDFVIKTDESTKEKAHRPSILYRFNIDWSGKEL
ncbi:MAG TPA: ADP-ribose pyrophosphatase [Clostridiales bacterium]|nr:ADP-ribose pyrophosphatase [Clostridiales bacterium]